MLQVSLHTKLALSRNVSPQKLVRPAYVRMVVGGVSNVEMRWTKTEVLKEKNVCQDTETVKEC